MFSSAVAQNVSSAQSLTNSYNLSCSEEKRFIADCMETIQRITGQRPVGWNAYWLRNSVHILDTLQELGFLYHIDEPSHDEPFIVPVNGRDFVTVPYTFHMNDISSFPFEGYNPMAYEQALKDEFDQLYEEDANRRRMMLVGFHDRINGHIADPEAVDRSTHDERLVVQRKLAGNLDRKYFSFTLKLPVIQHAARHSCANTGVVPQIVGMFRHFPTQKIGRGSDDRVA